ncbi:extracellular solute-binding protein [Rubripirellula lacrimiformis]|nr:extracellular solute-binding protein [Rubripirellula lacrimiformis]
MLNRRNAILGTAACLAAVQGCGPSDAPAPISEPLRTDIPLRIAMAATKIQSDAINRSWGSVSDQPLKITTTQTSRDSSAPIADLIAAAENSDVVVVPLNAVAELVANDAIAPMASDDMQELIDDLYPALRGGVVRFGNNAYALPLASTLPALLTTESTAPDSPIATWHDYDQWVGEQANQAAGEPTAPGWAAAMFLWRAAGSAQRWLFNRENFAPTIDEETYIDSLALMAKTVARYPQPRRTPDQVWSDLLDQKIAGGIGFPTRPPGNESEIRVAPLPGGTNPLNQNKPLFDPWLSVIAITTNCRQTDASRTFVQWITGGESSESARRQIAPFAPVRISDAHDLSDPYAQWLTQKLDTPVTLPTIQVMGAAEYYAALDDQVIRCLGGKSTPAESLAETAKSWRALTARIGIDPQLRTWRRIQGIEA